MDLTMVRKYFDYNIIISGASTRIPWNQNQIKQRSINSIVRPRSSVCTLRTIILLWMYCNLEKKPFLNGSMGLIKFFTRRERGRTMVNWLFSILIRKKKKILARPSFSKTKKPVISLLNSCLLCNVSPHAVWCTTKWKTYYYSKWTFSQNFECAKWAEWKI